MVYVKIIKKRILDFLISNKKIINQKLIEVIFEFIIISEEINVEPFDELKKKIRSCLISLKRSYERIKRNRFKLELFISACSKEYIEFPLKPIKLKENGCAMEGQMENLMNNLTIAESSNIEVLFNNMNI